jgi:hypothetical protein
MYVVVVAALLGAAGVGAFFVADWLRISTPWVFAFLLSPVLAIVAGRTVRPRLRQGRFLVFFVTWLALASAGTGWAMWEIGYAAILVGIVGLVIFWELTARLFGPPEFMLKRNPGTDRDSAKQSSGGASANHPK